MSTRDDSGREPPEWILAAQARWADAVRPRNIEIPGPGQESVWDYPRPPRLERESRTVRVEFEGTVIAQSARAQRVCETASPPTYYLPREDVDFEWLQPIDRSSVSALRRDRRMAIVHASSDGRVLCWRPSGSTATGRVLRRLDYSRADGAIQGCPRHRALVSSEKPCQRKLPVVLSREQRQRIGAIALTEITRLKSAFPLTAESA